MVITISNSDNSSSMSVWVVNEVIQSVLVLPVVTDDPGVVAGVDLVLEPVAVAERLGT